MLTEFKSALRNGDDMDMAETSGLDFAGALVRLGGNRTLFVKVAQYFIGASPRIVEDLRHAMQKRDGAEAGRLMHDLRGLAASAGLLSVSAIARQLESDLNRAAPPEKLEASAAALQAALAAGNAALSEFAAANLASGISPCRQPPTRR